MQSLADQNVEQLGGEGSVLVRQSRDHAELDRLMSLQAQQTGAERRATLAKLYRLVFPHAFAEESVLWPVYRRVLPDGDALTLRNEREHQQVNRAGVTPDALGPDTAGGAAALDTMARMPNEEDRDEEDLLLPRLQQALTPAQLRRLGLAWGLVRRIAPTRPHPVVSRRPPGNALAALPLTVLDRLRDRLDQVARTAPPPAGRTASTASRVLARVAGSVEQLSVMRRGERRDTRE